jgi:HlyD family secretion protein
VRRRLGLVALGLVAVVALAAVLPQAGRLGRALAPEMQGAPALSEVPLQAVERRDFAHRVPAEGNLRAVRSTPVQVPFVETGWFRIGWLAPDGVRVRTGDVVVRFDPTELAKSLSDAEDDLATARLKSAKQHASDQAEIDKLEHDAALAHVELDNAKRFQKKDPLIFSRHDIVESEIDQDLALEKERHARDLERTRGELERADAGLLAVDVRQAELKIRQAREGLRALAVTAPHDGVLIMKRNPRGEVAHVGDQVGFGATLAEIPDPSAMEAEVYVLEADAGGLASGRPATIEIEAEPGVAHPARIVRVDALAKPRLRGSPVQYFGVTLALQRTDPRVMKPGQRVRAVLGLAERRGALVVPRQAVFQRAGRNVVYRRRADGAGFDAVPVELGPSDLGTTVVESGVAAGDLVALRDPTRAAAPAAQPGAAPAGPPAGSQRPLRIAPGGAELP